MAQQDTPTTEVVATEGNGREVRFLRHKDKDGFTWNHGVFGRQEVEGSVVVYPPEGRHTSNVTLIFRSGAFHFQQGISPAEARLLAKALQDAAYDADMKNEWHAGTATPFGKEHWDKFWQAQRDAHKTEQGGAA
jgi:hypothetical protein